MCVQSLVSAEWTGGCLERATVLITTDGPDLLAPETTPLGFEGCDEAGAAHSMRCS